MSKLYFYYGTVCSSKTLNLLAVYKNYEVQGRKAILIRPELDTRSNDIESRAGLKATPDINIGKNKSITESIINYFNNNNIEPDKISKSIECVIVDECQFLTVDQLKELRKISIELNLEFKSSINNDTNKIVYNYKEYSKKEIEHDKKFECYRSDDKVKISFPVMCYGLRTTSEGVLWDSSAFLMAQADELHEIKTICSFCNKRAVFSAINPEKKKSSTDGKLVNPSWGYYIPVCPKHFFEINESE